LIEVPVNHVMVLGKLCPATLVFQLQTITTSSDKDKTVNLIDLLYSHSTTEAVFLTTAGIAFGGRDTPSFGPLWNGASSTTVSSLSHPC
jgi:hypothetical protein